MWPKIARDFGLEVADPIPFSLAIYMKDKGALWDEMVQKYGLRPTPYETLVSWPFGDFILHSDFDNISSTIKARVAGFHDCIDTEHMSLNCSTNCGKRRSFPKGAAVHPAGFLLR